MRPVSGTYKSLPLIRLSLKRLVIPFIVLIVLSVQVVRAQQNPILTQYMFNQMTFNPGYAGSNGGICVNGLIREQWLGFKGNEGEHRIAPETIFLSVDAPVKFLHGALGGSIMMDRVGFFENFGLKIGYAFRTEMGMGDFSAGLQANLMSYSIDFAKFDGHIIDPGDPVFQDPDKKTDMTIDAYLGVYYEVQDKYYIGLSAGQLFQSKAKNSNYKQRRTYYLTGGYNWMIPNHPTFELKPSALFYYDGAVFGASVSALVTYKKKFWGGLEGRFYPFDNAIAILAGANIKSFRIGMSYDISTSSLGRFSNGSIEVMLGYCFKISVEKYRKRYKNTRFL